MWANLLLAWGVQASALISPGPGVMFLVALATAQGRKHGLSARPLLALYGAARRWIEAGLGVFFAFAAYTLATARS